MIKDKILIIDDETGIRSTLKGILEDESFDVKTTASGEQGLDLMKEENFDLVFLDIWLPKMNGIDVLEKIKVFEENTQVVMITGHGTVETAVKATKLGAYDFLEKPLSLEKVVLTAKNALRHKKLEEENIQLREKVKAKLQLIGNTPSMEKLKSQIKTAAPTDGRILIYGENGTGKELVARLIHQLSPRKHKQFIQINCAAIPDELIESELFGYVKGAFPEVNKDKKGKLLHADGGTLFLDEIGDLSVRIQTKLLKVIKEKKFEALGTSHPISIDSRIIAATDQNPQELIAQKKLREDFYFKLNVIPMAIPPLRERKDDIALLISHFLKHFSKEYGKKEKSMSKAALQAFINYSWPGNVSELINVIERFVIMIPEDEIQESHLFLLVEPLESQFTSGTMEKDSLNKATEKFEREYIQKTLINLNWNIDLAAQELDLNKNFLQEKIDKLGILFPG